MRLNLQLAGGTTLLAGEGTVFWTREADPKKQKAIVEDLSSLLQSAALYADDLLAQRERTERTVRPETRGE